MRILMINLTKMVNHSDGVAKVVCAFANEMVRRGHEVSVIHSDEKEGNFFFPLDETINIFNANKNIDGSLIKRPVYLKILREMYRIVDKEKAQLVNRNFDEKNLVKNIERYIKIAEPDIIISHQPESSMFVLYNLGIDVPVITMSHGLPKEHFDEKELYALEHSVAFSLLQSSFEESINKKYPKVRTVVIGNSVPQFNPTTDLFTEKELYRIVFVGRLNKNTKRPHIIIQAFSKIVNKHPNWIVELFGEKERQTYYAELKHLIKNNGLDDKVFFERNDKQCC